MFRRHPVSQTVTKSVDIVGCEWQRLSLNEEGTGKTTKISEVHGSGAWAHGARTSNWRWSWSRYRTRPARPPLLHEWQRLVSLLCLPRQARSLLASVLPITVSKWFFILCSPFGNQRPKKGISMVGPQLPGQEEERCSPSHQWSEADPAFHRRGKGFRLLEVREGKKQ